MQPVKLHSKILLLVIPIVVLPLVWLGWAAYSTLEENSRENTLGQMNTLVDQVGRSILAHQVTAQSNIELFAGSKLVKKYILTGDEADRYTLMQPSLMRLFASYQRAYPDYYELRILLPDGYEDARSTLTRLPNKAVHEKRSLFFKKLKSTKKKVQVHYSRNLDNGKSVLYVAKRLILRDDSFEPIGTPPSMRGYLVITASLDFLQDQLNTQRIGNNGYLFVMDGSGRPFLTPQNVKLDPFSKEQYAQLQQAAKDNRIIKMDHNGHSNYMHGYALHPGLQLYAVLPESDVLAASRTLGTLVTGITLLTMLVASALIFYVINRILIRPIQKLGQTANEVGRGQFNARTGITSRDEIGELAHLFEDMSRNLQESQDHVTYLAYHDALTGLPNRHMFQEYLQRALPQAQRRNSSLALLFMDLDNFKQVNDTMGHQAGDQLLQQLSARITDCLRKEDQLSRINSTGLEETPPNTVSRLGGDEFMILLTDLKNPSDAAIVAQRILDTLAAPFSINNNDFFISSSIGISLYPTDGDDVHGLIKNADIAMYHAKEHGRNNYQYFNESMNSKALERLIMENALREAITNQEFILYYQPKVDMRSGNIKGVEALIRWQHPELGMVSPAKFIPLAEESSLIVPIGEWVINEATHQLAVWQEDGLELSMSINISTAQLNQQNVAEVLQKAIERTKCRADLLEIELTETSIMDAHEHATNMLNDIKSLGVQISMDDFGTGYSSFSYLRDLPIDILKIDRSFVCDITIDQDDATIIAAILAMAHTLNLVVVAEGVETDEQLQFLRAHRCDIVQGYLISRPIPETELRQFIIEYKRLDVLDSKLN